MDTPAQRGQAGRGLPSFNLALTTLLVFLHPLSLLSPVSAAAVGHHDGLGHALRRRTPGEHVVLADCRDGSGTVSSEMAYFPGDPGPSPQDVAVVATPKGQAALWVNANTTGLFTDTSVWFNATLGPKVDDGQFAGTGTNGYGNFSCYQKYASQLYTYGGTTCSQVYLCDHSTPPGKLGIASLTDAKAGLLTCTACHSDDHQLERHVRGHRHRHRRRRRRGPAVPRRRGTGVLVLPAVAQGPGIGHPAGAY
jgi:hypothetical protein